LGGVKKGTIYISCILKFLKANFIPNFKLADLSVKKAVSCQEVRKPKKRFPLKREKKYILPSLTVGTIPCKSA
jgi:hypothetical protein